MNFNASSLGPKGPKTRRMGCAVFAAAILATSFGDKPLMAQELLPTAVPAHPGLAAAGADKALATVYTDAMYKQALDYMVSHPPRAYGHGADVASENEHLAEENMQLYEGMSRLELIMNYLAAKCSEMHPVHDAICDGRAMLRLLRLQQRNRDFAGS